MRFPDPTKSLAEQDEEILLTLTLWGEGRGESPRGRSAIGHVILNRCRARSQPLRTVVLAPWQFSCFNVGDPNRKKIEQIVASGGKSVGLGEWAACWNAANRLLTGGTDDVSCGATHYCTKKLWARPAKNPKKPQWFELPCIADGTTKRTAVIDSHVFAITK